MDEGDAVDDRSGHSEGMGVSRGPVDKGAGRGEAPVSWRPVLLAAGPWLGLALLLGVVVAPMVGFEAGAETALWSAALLLLPTIWLVAHLSSRRWDTRGRSDPERDTPGRL